MVAKNDITGDAIMTKTSSEAYRNNYDSIFRKKPSEPVSESTESIISRIAEAGTASGTTSENI